MYGFQPGLCVIFNSREHISYINFLLHQTDDSTHCVLRYSFKNQTEWIISPSLTVLLISIDTYSARCFQPQRVFYISSTVILECFILQ